MIYFLTLISIFIKTLSRRIFHLSARATIRSTWTEPLVDAIGAIAD